MRPFLLLLAACTTDPAKQEPRSTPETENPTTETPEEPGLAPSTRADLRLKRWRQISLDLQGALELTEDEICRETGNYDCTDLHAAQLGGISIDNALYEPLDYWTVTTGLSIERMVLQACWNRLEKDRAGTPVVYKHLDLSSQVLSETEADAQSTELWQRILARDPSSQELDHARALHRATVTDGAGNADWAVMLCFSLATSTEHLMY